MELKIAGLVPESITDGPGFRFTVFCQGCPHHCVGCHNPQTWSFEGGETCTAEELYAQIRRDPLVRGVTFSGGEPFCQAGALAQLAAQLRQEGYEVASYSGWTLEQLLQKAAVEPDVQALLHQLNVLVDGPFVLEQRSLEVKFKGSRNQRILDVPASLAVGAAVLLQDGRWQD